MIKVIRTICYFTRDPCEKTIEKLNKIEQILVKNDFQVQTKRICSSKLNFSSLRNKISDTNILLAIGPLDFKTTRENMDDFLKNKDISFHLDLTNERVEKKHGKILFDIIERNPGSTFCFAYTFNNVFSSPYFPSAQYEKEGFSIGLQPTDLAENCKNLDQWFNKMHDVWKEVNALFKENKDFLGIDSSIAPIFNGNGSLIHFMKLLNSTFNESLISDNYLKITHFIKNRNPNPVGLCGLMVPCLEDFELAEEYEKGNFTIERNLFLSLHSGLGIDTYPVGIDEDINKVVNILNLVQGLSNKYNKPLSIRFVSDGKAKIWQKTTFNNQYLKDVIVKPL